MRTTPDDLHWRKICQIALLETDDALIASSVANARAAMAARESEDDVLPAERLAIENARRLLDKKTENPTK